MEQLSSAASVIPTSTAAPPTLETPIQYANRVRSKVKDILLEGLKLRVLDLRVRQLSDTDQADIMAMQTAELGETDRWCCKPYGYSGIVKDVHMAITALQDQELGLPLLILGVPIVDFVASEPHGFKVDMRAAVADDVPDFDVSKLHVARRNARAHRD